MTTTTAYLYALKAIGISHNTLCKLLDYFKTPETLWNASEKSISACVSARSNVDKWMALRRLIQPEALLEKVLQAGYQVLSRDHESYPPGLLRMESPPWVISMKGSLECLGEKSLAIVGTRHASDYGLRVTDKLVSEISHYQPVIVSGLAAGIDTRAHQAALNNGLKTIAVFGTGLDVIYPRQNKALSELIIEHGGGFISEYPLGFHGDRYTFPERNRIIAGLTEASLVVEGAKGSGALITAQFALDENRTVMAVPGNIFSPYSYGPHQLLKQGAFYVSHGEDIAEALNWEAQKEKRPDAVQLRIAEPEHPVLQALSFEPMALETLQHQFTNWPELSAHLTLLELEGKVKSLPGGQYCRVMS
jgi:DNA processing protein